MRIWSRLVVHGSLNVRAAPRCWVKRQIHSSCLRHLPLRLAEFATGIPHLPPGKRRSLHMFSTYHQVSAVRYTCLARTIRTARMSKTDALSFVDTYGSLLPTGDLSLQLPTSVNNGTSLAVPSTFLEPPRRGHVQGSTRLRTHRDGDVAHLA